MPTAYRMYGTSPVITRLSLTLHFGMSNEQALSLMLTAKNHPLTPATSAEFGAQVVATIAGEATIYDVTEMS